MSAPDQLAPTIKLDPVALLLVAGAGVWLIAVLKLLQIGRLRRSERAFERAADGVPTGQELYAAAVTHRRSPGGRIVMMIASRSQGSTPERLRAIAERA